MFRQIFLLLACLLLASEGVHANPYACSEEIQRGIASWYGPGFDGARTTNEEIFNSALLSAAHPSLPFGTLLKIVNMRNRHSVYVRVNDRGGFSKERVIDVSRAAAEKLDMVQAGTAAVSIFRCNQ